MPLKFKRGAVAEWSKALLQSEDKINLNKKDPGFAPRPGYIKVLCAIKDQR